MLDAIRALKDAGQFERISDLVPYAGFVGFSVASTGGGLVTTLGRRASNIGNTQIPAIHGGVVGALIEHAAVMQLLYELDLETLPRIVNISVEYLRPARDEDTHARGVIVKEGRRVANVRVEAWQADPSRPVAAGYAHFLLG